MSVNKCWKKLKPSETDFEGQTWVNKKDGNKFVNVDNMTSSKIIDGYQSSVLKARNNMQSSFDVEVIKGVPSRKKEALDSAKSYMKKHNKC